jgi:hypothetical protein
MVCAASARIGVLPVTWWAVWDRRTGRLTEGRRGVTVTRDAVTVRGVFELTLGDGAAVEVTSPHGRQEIWTRKRIVPARGRFGDRELELHAIVDESAGYHASAVSRASPFVPGVELDDSDTSSGLLTPLSMIKNSK